MRLLRLFFKRYHEDIIRMQAWVNFIVCLLSACCLDSEGYTAEVVCGVTMLWLGLYAHANGYFAETNKIFQYEEDKTV